MEAPEKIYVSTDPFGWLHAYDCENHPPIVEEYVHKDTFIEKACEWLTQYILNHDQIDIFEIENDFRKAMEE